MTSETWLLYVGTVLLFMITPGPSHFLILSVSAGNGFRRSLATAAGDLSANALQIIAAGFGLAAVLASFRFGFATIKWAGVGYLVWIGLRQIIASFRSTAGVAAGERLSLRVLWLRGFVTSAANPKAVVFFAALFPQFLDSQIALGPQIAILGVTYIVIDGVFLLAYGKGACWIAGKIRSRYTHWLDRVAGSGLIAAAVLLGLRNNEHS